MVVMNKKLQVIKLKKLVGTKSDLFDFTAEVDGKLSFSENKKQILKKLSRIGLKTNIKKNRNVRSSKLIEKAININKKRKKSSLIVDGSRNAKKMFEARTLNKKQFIKWSKNKSKYDIEGVDSKGTHFKKSKLSKTMAKKLLSELDDIFN